MCLGACLSLVASYNCYKLEYTMRVCMIVPRYPPDRCGVGDYTYLLAWHLARRGVSVDILTSRGLSDAVTLPPTDGDVIVAGGAVVGAAGVRVRVLPLIDDWGWRSLARIYAVVRTGRYDVVHIQYQNEMYGRSASIAVLPLVLRAVRPDLPTVVTVHDYGTPWPRHTRVRLLAGPYGKAWFAAMLLNARRVILTNEQDEFRFLHQRLRYPIPASRYATIPVGSNLPIPAPTMVRATAEASLLAPQGSLLASAGTMTVGYFGFVNPAKGVDTLLEGFAIARRRRPHLQLVMICQLHGTNKYLSILANRIEQPDLADSVVITGELGDRQAADVLARCDIVALPFRDGVSLRRTTLMAALALGCPVISTRAVVPPAMLEDGRDLMLVPPQDAQALAQSIVELADDPDRRARLGAHAREVARAFAWPTIAERTVQLYQQAVAQSGRGSA